VDGVGFCQLSTTYRAAKMDIAARTLEEVRAAAAVGSVPLGYSP